MTPEEFNNMEWNKLFMGVAMAIVFILQAYSQLQHNNTKTSLVTKQEIIKLIKEHK